MDSGFRPLYAWRRVDDGQATAARATRRGQRALGRTRPTSAQPQHARRATALEAYRHARTGQRRRGPAAHPFTHRGFARNLRTNPWGGGWSPPSWLPGPPRGGEEGTRGRPWRCSGFTRGRWHEVRFPKSCGPLAFLEGATASIHASPIRAGAARERPAARRGTVAKRRHGVCLVQGNGPNFDTWSGRECGGDAR